MWRMCPSVVRDLWFIYSIHILLYGVNGDIGNLSLVCTFSSAINDGCCLLGDCQDLVGLIA